MSRDSTLSTARVLPCRERRLSLGRETHVVGIVNVTPDSFFDGGKFVSTKLALAQAERLVAEGAAMLDIGGQSTRPGHQEVLPEEEIARVVPVIAALAARVAVPISIDTYKPEVARAALEAGAHVLNDVQGFHGAPELPAIAAEFGCAVILMHQESNFRTRAGDSMEKMIAFFQRSLAIAEHAGVAREKIVLDPGIGFGKTQPQNLELVARLGELATLGCPLLLGASRKSFIGNVLGLDVSERLEGTLATTALAAWQRIDFVRVHDVAANVRTAKMARALREASSSV